MGNGSIIGLSVIFGILGGGKSCNQRTQEKTNSYEVGTCLRDPDDVEVSPKMGYWHLIVEKTSKSYVMCQGEYDYNFWYGCRVVDFPDIYNNPKYYIVVECPDWPIRDRVYSGNSRNIIKK